MSYGIFRPDPRPYYYRRNGPPFVPSSGIPITTKDSLAAVAATSSVAATPVVVVKRSLAVVASTSSVAATPVQLQKRSQAAVASTSTIAAAPVRLEKRSLATISSTFSVAATPVVVVKPSLAAVSSASTITPANVRLEKRSLAAPSDASTIAASPVQLEKRSLAAISDASSIAAAPVGIKRSLAALSDASSVSATPVVVKTSAATVAATSAITPATPTLVKVTRAFDQRFFGFLSTDSGAIVPTPDEPSTDPWKPYRDVLPPGSEVAFSPPYEDFRYRVGDAPDADYQVAVAQMQAAGILMLGIVHAPPYEVESDWGTAAGIKDQVDKYYDWYGVDGIYFVWVEPNSGPGSDYFTLTYDRNLEVSDYVRAQPGAGSVIWNASRFVPEEVLDYADAIYYMEEFAGEEPNPEFFDTPTWAAKHPPSVLAVGLYHAFNESEIRASVRFLRHIGVGRSNVVTSLLGLGFEGASAAELAALVEEQADGGVEHSHSLSPEEPRLVKIHRDFKQRYFGIIMGLEPDPSDPVGDPWKPYRDVLPRGSRVLFSPPGGYPAQNIPDVDPVYQEAVTQLRASGVEVFGMVSVDPYLDDSEFGTPEWAEAQIDHYYDEYGVDGIFFDGLVPNYEISPFFDDMYARNLAISEYVRAKPGQNTVTWWAYDPVATPESILDFADLVYLIISLDAPQYHLDASLYLWTPPWVVDHSPAILANDFYNAADEATRRQAIADSRALGIGWSSALASPLGTGWDPPHDPPTVTELSEVVDAQQSRGIDFALNIVPDDVRLEKRAQGTVTSASSVSAAPVLVKRSAATLAASSAITAAPVDNKLSAANVFAASSVTAVSRRLSPSAATVAAASQVSASPTMILNSLATVLAASNAVVATPDVLKESQATILAVHTILASSSGIDTRESAAEVDAALTLAAVPVATKRSAAEIDATSSVSGASTLVRPTAAEVDAASDIQASAPVLVKRSAATVASASQVSATPRLALQSAATVAASSSVSVVPAASLLTSAATVAGSSQIAAAPRLEKRSAASIDAASSAAASPVLVKASAASLLFASNAVVATVQETKFSTATVAHASAISAASTLVRPSVASASFASQVSAAPVLVKLSAAAVAASSSGSCSPLKLAASAATLLDSLSCSLVPRAVKRSAAAVGHASQVTAVPTSFGTTGATVAAGSSVSAVPVVTKYSAATIAASSSAAAVSHSKRTSAAAVLATSNAIIATVWEVKSSAATLASSSSVAAVSVKAKVSAASVASSSAVSAAPVGLKLSGTSIASSGDVLVGATMKRAYSSALVGAISSQVVSGPLAIKASAGEVMSAFSVAPLPYKLAASAAALEFGHAVVLSGPAYLLHQAPAIVIESESALVLLPAEVTQLGVNWFRGIVDFNSRPAAPVSMESAQAAVVALRALQKASLVVSSHQVAQTSLSSYQSVPAGLSTIGGGARGG